MAYLKSTLFIIAVISCIYGYDCLAKTVNSDVESYGCLCSHYTCGCCVHLEVPEVGLNDTGCVNITYLAKDYGISFTITIDKFTIFNETISARSPPPVCFGAPMLKEFADVCIHFYDLDIIKTKLHGCVDFEVRLHKIVVVRYKVGCFDIVNSKIDSKWEKYHREIIAKIRAMEAFNKL